MQSNVGYVYAIENAVNGRRYIGSTTNYKSRWHTHRSTLRRGKHHSFILQKAWDKYGEEAFVFKLLLVCDKAQRIDYENRLMPLQAYNVMRTAKESLVRGGWTHSDEFKQKMSLQNKGKVLTAEHRLKLSEHRKGRTENAAFKEKARARQTGVSPSKATRSKLSLATTAYRAHETEKTTSIVKAIHCLCMQGARVYETCKEHKITPTTFYRHVALLQLPLLGRKTRGCVQ
jgi:group I intron endonuclease